MNFQTKHCVSFAHLRMAVHQIKLSLMPRSVDLTAIIHKKTLQISHRVMDIYSMIEAGGRMKFEVTGEDLCKFAEVLIDKAQEMKAREMEREPVEETWLTKEETAKMCRVSKTTLWAWGKSGYLVPAKMGRRPWYALSDIQRILAARGDGSAVPSWGKGKDKKE